MACGALLDLVLPIRGCCMMEKGTITEMDILDDLNPVQRAAVESINGPQLVIAGPGSGKTRVITSRIAYLIQVCGVRPNSILAVTFTNKAAREMKKRVSDILHSQAEGLTIGTFHATCVRILRQEADRVGIDRNFVIYDDGDQIALINSSLQDLELNPNTRQVKRGIKMINLRKKEFDLLEFLLFNQGRVVSKSQILEQVWDYNFDVESKTVDVHISSLRSKVDKGFQSPYIHTVYGTGYKLDAVK